MEMEELSAFNLSRVSKELYAPALGGIMLSIGIRLSTDDFALAFKRCECDFHYYSYICLLDFECLKVMKLLPRFIIFFLFCRPLPLSLGFIAQYVLKPALGVLIAKAFGMPRMFYAGFILTACVSGAQLSSYASFISKGDVALSILLTSSTTIASVLVTPLLTGLLIGSVVPVDAVSMSKSILQVSSTLEKYSANWWYNILPKFNLMTGLFVYIRQVVLVPVILGLLLNTYAKPVVSVLQPVMPFVAMICTSICIGSPLAINRSQILSSEGLLLVFPVLTFHVVAFALGYWFSNIPSLRYAHF